MIELKSVGKVFERRGDQPVRALDDISITVERGELLAIVGASGSGKSTMMNVLGLLDRPSTGTFLLSGKNVTDLSANEQARLRNRHFGFVFQAFRLLPRATAIENVELPLLYSDRRKPEGLARAALEAVGLGERMRHRPSEMSGGQQQRVAIARALVNEPDVILADEPTGNLDARSALEIMAIFQRLNRAGRTVVIVTHDPGLAEHCQRVARIDRGRIASDTRIEQPRDAAEALTQLAAAPAA